MKRIRDGISENKEALVKYKSAPKFSQSGQATQMIIGATPETDYKILMLTEGLYKKYSLKRVFYSAYIPVVEGRNLPAKETKPPLLREHRLYQADWLLRFYGFAASEILDERHQEFNNYIDPKCNWALNHMDEFPLEVNKAPYEMLLRVPGIGIKGAKKILTARREGKLDFDDLKKLGVTLKRAQYFLTCKEKTLPGLNTRPEAVLRGIMSEETVKAFDMPPAEQLSLFDKEDSYKMPDGTIITYLYDGSYDGFLCCVYESFKSRETPADILLMTRFSLRCMICGA
jgi:predicted DNA-binding helix-hairpin-helix protein